MPIKVVAAPRNAQSLLRAGIQKHLATGMLDPALGEVSGLGAPHRVFHLGLDALVAGQPIAEAAQHVGWRALLVDRGGAAVASAELVAQRGRLRFASVTRGGHVAGHDEGESTAEAWARQATGDHELALLRIPGAYCVALWLRGAKGGDAFIPLAPCPPSLKPNVAIGEAELREALLPEARKQLQDRTGSTSTDRPPR